MGLTNLKRDLFPLSFLDCSDFPTVERTNFGSEEMKNNSYRLYESGYVDHILSVNAGILNIFEHLNKLGKVALAKDTMFYEVREL